MKKEKQAWVRGRGAGAYKKRIQKKFPELSVRGGTRVICAGG